MVEIKVSGPGCGNGHAMEQRAKTALREPGIEARVGRFQVFRRL